MSYLDALLLGIVQGITEFLPISSSGHLVVVRDLFHIIGQNDLAVDALLQLATALAVVVFFRRDFIEIGKNILSPQKDPIAYKKNKILLQVLVVGTIPAVIFGLVLENAMETLFRNSTLVAVALLLGSALMICAEKVYSGTQALTMPKGLVLGLFQALALVPGMSRSGATISGGMILGLSREDATRTSFMLAVPILLGSGLKKSLELFGSGMTFDVGPLLLAFAVSFCVGLFAIRFLLQYLRSNKLYAFVYYRVGLALLLLFSGI
jgi:undecaprenyl-diphosphatase